MGFASLTPSYKLTYPARRLRHLDKSAPFAHEYHPPHLDIDTDARLREMADERGQDVAAVLAEAIALLDSVVDIADPISARTADGLTPINGHAQLYRWTT